MHLNLVNVPGLGFVMALALAGAAFAATDLPDADPATVQAYLDDPLVCPLISAAPPVDIYGNCHLALPCEVSTVTGASTSWALIRIHDMQNVVISGCGMNGTRIKWIDPPNSGSSRLISIDGASKWITIRDMGLDIQCTGACTNSTMVTQVAGDVEEVTFERVHFHASRAQGAVGTNPAGLGVGAAGAPARRISAYGSRFHATGYGLSLNNCEDCWFDANWLGPNVDGGIQAYALASKDKGSGVRFVNNTFDMGGDVVAGLYLRSKPDDTLVNATAQVIGNSFINLQDDISGTTPQRALDLYRYDHANIQGNLFSCATGDAACTALGIDFLNGGPSSNICPPGLTCNKENLIADNIFVGIVDDNLNQCAIRLHNALDANFDNVIRGNIFRLGTGTAIGADGLCGAKSSTSINPQHENKVFGP